MRLADGLNVGRGPQPSPIQQSLLRYITVRRNYFTPLAVLDPTSLIMVHDDQKQTVSISPLLKRLAYPLAAEIQVEASEIASAFALIFEDRLNVVQTTALLTLLHSTRKDKDPAVIAQCSQRMREAASQIERTALQQAIRSRDLKRGRYRGGLVWSNDTLNSVRPY